MHNFNCSYDGVRMDLLDLAGISFNEASVLDLGCYRGANGQYLKSRFHDVYYVGVENDPNAIEAIDSSADEVFCLDLDQFNAAELGARKFDVVILGDVIEHLKDPGGLLEEIKKVTHEDSAVLVSIPNIQYYETFLMLLFGRFPRRDRGIFDKTHLRWFTKREFVKLVKDDYKIAGFKRIFRLVERPSRINMLVPLFQPLLWIIAPFFTFQMYFLLKKIN